MKEFENYMEPIKNDMKEFYKWYKINLQTTWNSSKMMWNLPTMTWKTFMNDMKQIYIDDLKQTYKLCQHITLMTWNKWQNNMKFISLFVSFISFLLDYLCHYISLCMSNICYTISYDVTGCTQAHDALWNL